MVEFANPRYGVNEFPSDGAASEILNIPDPEGLGTNNQESAPESSRRNRHHLAIRKNIDSAPRAHHSPEHTTTGDGMNNFSSQRALIPRCSPMELHQSRPATPRRRGVRPRPEQSGLPGHLSLASVDNTAARPENTDAGYRVAIALDSTGERRGSTVDGTHTRRPSMDFQVQASPNAHRRPERADETAPVSPRRSRRGSPSRTPTPVRNSCHYCWIYSSRTPKA
ncbi:hypothetical protein ACFVH0_15025 [Streptomyces sp. NPDC127117]|uniref:hypothetical protein n=1 Tax=Streptomyces sp. NPDC127117 TaxID=3345368 RepID=UPI00363F83D5